MKACEDEAYRLALRFLIRGWLPQKKVMERLGRRGFSAEVITKVCRRLTAFGYLDDLRYAQNWISARQAQKPSGRARLQAELKRLGIAPDVQAQALATYFGETDSQIGALEQELALEVGQKRLAQLQGTKLSREVLYRRLGGFLSRRGFAPNIVYRVLATLLDTGSENQ